MNNNKINKNIENLILKHLRNSNDFWVDLIPFIEKSEYSYIDFHNVLIELILENKIKIKDGNNISILKLTKKGKLVNNNGLYFRIDKKGIKTKWYNQLWIGFLIAFFSLILAVFQFYENHTLKKDISKSIDSLKNTNLFHKKILDSLNTRSDSLEKKLFDLKKSCEIKKTKYKR